MPPAPAARRSTWRSGSRGSAQASGLLTGLSTDLLGQRLSAVLAAEGVSTAYAIATERPTTISLVGLDTAGVPAYQFYKNGSADTGVAPGRPAGDRARR